MTQKKWIKTSIFIWSFFGLLLILAIKGCVDDAVKSDEEYRNQLLEERKQMSTLDKVKHDYTASDAYYDCRHAFEYNPALAIDHPSRAELVSQNQMLIPYFTKNKNSSFTTKAYITIKDKLTEIKYNVYCFNTVYFNESLDKIDKDKTIVKFTGISESDEM